MTFVGKTVTVFIFLMSLLFLAFAVMVKINHVNWKQMAADLAPQITDTESDVLALRQEKAQLEDAIKHEQAALRSALIALEVRAIQTEQILKQKTAAFEALDADRLKRIEELTNIGREIKGLVDDIAKFEADIRDAKLTSASEFDRVVAVTTQIHEAVGMHQRLTERYNQLRAQIEALEADRAAPAPAAAASDSTGRVR